MIKLSREIRFALVPPDRLPPRDGSNSWAGWPATNLIVPQLVLSCVVAGEPNATSGYLCNIKLIDEMLRNIVIERLIPEFWLAVDRIRTDNFNVAQAGVMVPETMLNRATELALSAWKSDFDSEGEIESLTLAVSPFLSYSIYCEEPAMIALTQQFEFSAAHRLHSDGLSNEENRELFGKCNNPAGHGHNYVIEVTLNREVEGQVINLRDFESIVKRLVIDRLDHKHLNQDVDHFANINPTVENISIAIYEWLDGQFNAANLEKIRVYETPKTWAEFSGVT